jgi:hypothetical protein
MRKPWPPLGLCGEAATFTLQVERLMMKGKFAWRLCVIGALLVLGSPLAQSSTPEESWGQAAAPAVRVLTSDAEAIVFEVLTPRPAVEEIRVGDEVEHRVRVAGLDALSLAGAPELPVQSVMLGIPPGATWTVELESTDRVMLEGPYRLLPGASAAPGLDSWAPSGERIPDAAIYTRSLFYPADVVEALDSGYLRDQRFLSLRVNPIRYNPVTGQVEWFQRIRVRIRLSGADLSACDGEQDGYFEPVLRATILNYEQAKAWRSREPGSVEAQAGPICGIGPQYKVIVNSEGMHEITHADLLAAGFPITSVDPMRLTMCYMGQEIAIRVTGQEDHVFNTTDRILFYGTVPYSRYTDTSTYWLSFGASDGKRMGAKDGTVNAATPYVPAHAVTAAAEQSLRYDSLYPSPKGDHWFWDDLRWLDVAPYTPRSYTVQLKEPPAGVANAVLRVGLQGYTPNLHELNFSFNGLSLGSRMWAGPEYRTLSFLVPTTSLRTGGNTLTLSSKDMGATPDGAWLDFFSVEYAAQNVALEGKSLAFKGQSGAARYWLTGFADASVEVYDVSDVRNVAQMAGVAAKMVRITRLPSVWARGGAAAAGQDAILFNSKQDDTLSHVAAIGGYGIAFQGNEAAAPTYWAGTASALKRPVAILHDPVTNWRSPALGADYLLITNPSLITEANRLVAHHQDQGLQPLVVYVQDIYDEFNHGRADPEAIRAFLQYAYAQWSLRPSYVLLFGDGSYDFLNHTGYGAAQMVPPYLAMVDRTMGETATDNRYAAVHGDDILPDMYIGRLPAANLAQARAIVDKIVQYLAVSTADGWNKKIILVSDKPDAPAYNNFIQASDDVYDWLGAAATAYTRTRVYFDPSSSGVPWVHAEISAAKAAMLTNLNQGALFWNFMGHASEHQWIAERLLHVDDVAGLANGFRLPVLLDMTCQTGQFHLPQAKASDECLAEALIRHPGGGTVASWSPTGWGMASGHDVMQQAFYEAVFTGGVWQLGPAIAVGAVRAYNAGYNDLVDTFILLGDPALFLRQHVAGAVARDLPFGDF